MIRGFTDDQLHDILRLSIDERWPKNGVTDDNITDIVAEIQRRADGKADRDKLIDISLDVVDRFMVLYPLAGRDWVKPYAEILAAKTAWTHRPDRSRVQ